MFLCLQPLIGPHADDARELIDIPYLTGLYNGQAQAMMVQERVEHWLMRANQLSIPHGPTAFRLRLLQEFISWTAPNERCPCNYGVPLPNSDDHWDGCPRAEEVRVVEEAQRAIDEAWTEDLAVQQAAAEKQKKREAMQCDYARVLNGHWPGVAVTSRLSDGALRRIAHDITDEVVFRYNPILSVYTP